VKSNNANLAFFTSSPSLEGELKASKLNCANIYVT